MWWFCRYNELACIDVPNRLFIISMQNLPLSLSLGPHPNQCWPEATISLGCTKTSNSIWKGATKMSGNVRGESQFLHVSHSCCKFPKTNMIKESLSGGEWNPSFWGGGGDCCDWLELFYRSCDPTIKSGAMLRRFLLLQTGTCLLQE